MTIAIISHPDCILHDIPDHPERPDRIKTIHKAIEAFPFDHPTKHYLAKIADLDNIALVHDQDYIKWLISIAPKEGLISIDPDTYMNPHTLTAARYAAGAAIQAVDLVLSQAVKAAFCNVRPPGHHAERDKAMGFCFFNNVAIAARYAMQRYHLKRVAIIDFDVHHGNGTQNIFQQDKNVMYCSSFQHPFYPGYESEMDNEHLLAVPLAAGTDGDTYRRRVEEAWFDKLADFQPEMIFFSAGFDAHAHDPLANLNLSAEDYAWLTKEIVKIANVYSDSRVVSVLEGGYDLTALYESVPEHINALIFDQ